MNAIKVGFGVASSKHLLKQFWSLSTRKISSESAEPVIIRIPRRIQDRINHVNQVKRQIQGKVPTVKAGRMLIKCKNPVFNQSVCYTLGKFEEPVLASKGWKNNKSFGDYFTINNTRNDPPFFSESKKDGADQRRTFASLHLSAELVTSLQTHNLIYPTTVQLQAIPRLLKGHNVLCAAETGSGKTLAYLLPIIHKLHNETDPEDVPESYQKTRAVVLVPSRELSEQVTAVAKAMSRPFGFKVKVIGGGRGVASIKSAFLHGQPDILVATPGALLKALSRHFVDLTELRFMVVDEADTMFDSSFSGSLEKILTQIQVSAKISETVGQIKKAQLVVVGATFPGGLGELLSKVTDLGTLVSVKSRNLHFLMPHVKQTFLKVRGSEKILELHQAVKEAEREAKGVLVFCNSAATVNWLGFKLEEMGLRHVRLQGEMPASMRDGIFQSYQKGHVDVMVCTDIASRGLDTQRVGLVVNYDFPESYTDYIHRSGRVGRAGGSGGGHIISFVTHLWDVDLVQSIETAARRRTSLPGMEKEIQISHHQNINTGQ